MITTYLPWIALVVGIAAVLSRDGKKPSAEEPTTSRFSPISRSATLTLIVLALAALLAGWKWQASALLAMPAALGCVAGILIALIAERLGRSSFQRGALIAGPLGIAVAARGLGSLHLPYWLREHEIGLGLGVALGAWVLTSLKEDSDGWSVRTAVFLNAMLLVDRLGGLGHGERAGHAGLALGAAAAFFAAAVPSLLGMFRFTGPKPAAWCKAAFVVLLAVSAYLVAWRYVWLHDTWRIFVGAMIVALVVHWFMPKDREEGALPMLLAVVVWLGAATLAFGYLRGFGMSVALLAAATVFLFLDDRLGLVSLAPLAALTVFRVFRELHESASRALDIGQHYSLIGLLAGMALIALAVEARRKRPDSAPAAAIMAVLMLAVPVLAAALIAAKGYVGVMVGMGFSFLILGAPRLRSAIPLAVQMGIGMLMAGAYGWFEAIIDLSRGDKVKVLIYAVVASALLVGGVLYLTRQDGAAKPEEVAS